MTDPSTQFLQDLFSWTSIVIWLSLVILWFVFKTVVQAVGRTKPGKVAFALIPVLAIILILAGAWTFALFVLLLFILILAVLWRSRARGRGDESEFSREVV